MVKPTIRNTLLPFAFDKKPKFKIRRSMINNATSNTRIRNIGSQERAKRLGKIRESKIYSKISNIS